MKSILSLASMMVLALSITACGANSKKIVSNVDVETETRDGSVYLSTDFELAIGAAQLPSMSLPLANGYGSMSLSNVDGVNHVGLDLNLSQVLNASAGDATLPNGNAIPVDTLGNGVLEIPVNGMNGKVYVAYSGDVVLVGFAASISQLDAITSKLGSIGVFPSFNIGSTPVTAGFYTSSNAGQSGIAAFASVSGIMGGEASARSAREAFGFVQEDVPAWKERLLGKRLYRLKSKDQVLKIAQ